MYTSAKRTKAGRLFARSLELNELKERGATVTEYPEADCIAAVWENGTRTVVKIYDGTAASASIYTSFRDNTTASEYVKKAVETRINRKARRAEERAKQNNMSDHAATAAAIRAKLAKVFPGVKFSVTSKSFAGGDSVNVNWTDGPIAELVDHYVKQYQAGYFDGMTDSYNYVSVSAALGCPGVKYAFAERTISDKRRAEIEAAALECCETLPDNEYYGTGFNARRWEKEHPELWDEAYRAEQERQQAAEAAARREHEMAEKRVQDELEQERAAASNRKRARNNATEAYKAELLSRFEELCSDPAAWDHQRCDESGWEAHHLSKNLFECNPLFDPYAPEHKPFIDELRALCPYYIGRYLDSEEAEQPTENAVTLYDPTPERLAAFVVDALGKASTQSTPRIQSNVVSMHDYRRGRLN